MSQDKKFSIEHRRKLSESHLGIKYPNRKKISLTEEHKLNISKALKGKKNTEETKQQISKTLTGRAVPIETKQKISQALKGRKLTKEHIANSRIGHYKGDDAKPVTIYNRVHVWVYELLGKPDTCWNCSKTGLQGRQIHWANLSGEYLYDVDDWARLCQSCHSLYDRGKILLDDIMINEMREALYAKI